MISTATTSRTTDPVAASGPEARRSGRTAAAAISIGVVTAIVMAAFDWVPSVWFDEAATVVSATRSWSALWREAHHIDAVHLAYYAVMHVWFDLVGYDPFTLRLPSAVAIGVAAALVVVLGRVLVDLRVGVVAAIMFALFPRVTWMGSEGRSFAIDTALATAATLLFVLAHRRTLDRRRSWPLWVAYVVVSLAGGASFLYLVFDTIGHGVTAALPLLRRSGRSRRNIRGLAAWAVAAVLATVPLLPLAKASSAQSQQVDWIDHISAHTVEEVLVTQWFDMNPTFAVFGCVLAIGGAILAVSSPRTRWLVAVALPWAAVPTFALIALSLVTNPLYSPRYVGFAAPSAALCIAAPIVFLSARWAKRVAAVVLVVAAGISAPTFVRQRTVTFKDDSAWNEVAALVAHERSLQPAGEHDAIVYGPVERHPSTTSRIIAETYPSAFAGIADPLLITPAAHAPGLWATQRPLADIATRTGDADVVWLVTAVSPNERPVVAKALAKAGFHQRQSWTRARTQVVEYVR